MSITGILARHAALILFLDHFTLRVAGLLARSWTLAFYCGCAVRKPLDHLSRLPIILG